MVAHTSSINPVDDKVAYRGICNVASWITEKGMKMYYNNSPKMDEIPIELLLMLLALASQDEE